MPSPTWARITAAGLVLALAHIAPLGAQDTTTPPPVPAPVEAPKPRPCADLVAEKIHVSLIAKTNPAIGTVKVVGVVKNRGPAAFQGRLQISLSRGVYTGFGAPNITNEHSTSGLAPDQEVKVEKDVSWDARSPQDVFLEIKPLGYAQGPDGMPLTPECDHANNARVRKGAEITATLFGPGPYPARATLVLRSHKFVTGGLEATLQYSKESGGGRILAYLEPPFSGGASPVAITQGQGTATVRVIVRCQPDGRPSPGPGQQVRIIYSITEGVSAGNFGYVASPVASASQSVLYSALCGGSGGRSVAGDAVGPQATADPRAR
jgi:hypothetical protein